MHRINSPVRRYKVKFSLFSFFLSLFPERPFLIFPLAGVSLRRSRRRRQRYNLFARATSTGVGALPPRNKV